MPKYLCGSFVHAIWLVPQSLNIQSYRVADYQVIYAIDALVSCVCAGATTHPSSVGWPGGVDASDGRTGWCQVPLRVRYREVLDVMPAQTRGRDVHNSPTVSVSKFNFPITSHMHTSTRHAFFQEMGLSLLCWRVVVQTLSGERLVSRNPPPLQ